MDRQAEIKRDLKQAVIKHCRLSSKMSPEEIDDGVSFFEGGLGLDSIDILELIVHVEKTYQLKIRNTPDGRSALETIDTLTQAILAAGDPLGSGPENRAALENA